MCSVSELPTKVEQSSKNLIEKEGYLTHELHLQRILTNGGSFFGKLYEVTVKGKTKDGVKETNLFLKVINGGEEVKWISIVNLYRIELFAYNELSEIFSELQEDANVPSHGRFKITKSYEDSSTEAIILENIATKGFKMVDRVEVVSLELAEWSIIELAKLHGLSFALQEKRPEYFNRKIKEIRYPVTKEQYNTFVINMINLAMKHIDEDVRSRVENKYHKLADKHAQFFEDEAMRRCICHGDYKLSNMMVKINNGKVIDFIAVDYQFMYYGCPVLDILYFIFINTDQQFRKAHLSHLKDLYHETLRTFLEYFNIDVDSVYSRELFEQDFKEKLDYGLLVGFTVLPLALVNEDDAPDLTGDVSGTSFQVSDKYRDRQRGIIEEFIEWGYM